MVCVNYKHKVCTLKISLIASDIFFDSARKTAMLTCKIALIVSPHPIIVSKNPGFLAFYLDGQKIIALPNDWALGKDKME